MGSRRVVSSYTGDVVAQGMSMFIRKGAHFVVTGSQRQRQYIGQAVTEEWHLAPGFWKRLGFLKKLMPSVISSKVWKRDFLCLRIKYDAIGTVPILFDCSGFLAYGLDELIPKMRITLPLRMGRHLLFWMRNKHKDKPLGERLRLALQELGPVWIKFGQMMSTRRDLFPPMIADQLALLQDRVAPFDGALARKQIEDSMGGPLEQWFDDFDQNALASASIAQVHTAKLKENGQEIVLKVIRPDILPIIKADVRLMYRLAGWVPKLMPDGRRLRPREVVREYEKTLLDELNLLREAANAIQLRRNFEGSPMLYVPEIYSDYCRENVLVMERIYGIPVSDLPALHAQNTNMKLLAERGVQVFFTQVFRDSFFHADMHPGNIFVSFEHPENPQYIGIDCGIVGSLNKDDKRYLAENFIAFFNRDYRKVAELHVDFRLGSS